MGNRTLAAYAVALLIAAGAAHAQGAVVTKSVTMSIIGRGITAVGPTSCTTNVGVGSANTAVCQLTATTIPAGQAVTWTLTGGPDRLLFALTPAGALSVGAADLPATAGPWSITATATAP